MQEKKHFRECNCDVPETLKDINEFIYTFLHVEESEIFQLLHNEVDENGISLFQVYGRFRGVKIRTSDDEERFLIKEVDLKLINMKQKDTTNFFQVKDAKISKSTENNSIDFMIYIKSIERQEAGIDFVLEQEFLLNCYQIIDNHVEITGFDPVTRNGIPCKNAAFF